MLVPMLAPMMMPIACATFIMPEFTKPTTMTVVADEDCMIAVTAVPKSTPLIGVFVSLYNISSSFSPAAFFSPSPIRDIPNRKSATPLSNDKIDVIPMSIFFLRSNQILHSFSVSLLCIYSVSFILRSISNPILQHLNHSRFRKACKASIQILSPPCPSR